MRDRVDAFFQGWRVAVRIIGLTFRAELEYRAQFLSQVAFGVAWQASIIVFATVILGRFSGMAGWASRDVMLIVGMRMFSHGLFVLFFDRTYQLTALVQEGRLDGFLLRPLPVYRQVQLALFPTNALGDILVGVAIFGWAIPHLGLHWTAAGIAYVSAGLIGGTLMEGAIFSALSSAHLHYPSSHTWTIWIEELFSTFGNYPLRFLPSVVSGAFTFVLPLAFIAYFPAAVLTHNTSGLGVPELVAALAPAVGLAAYIGSRLLFKLSLRYYTGVTG